ncbi:MAG: DNA photolyase family protein [Ignavibacteria bacterium]|nr:DNA photolyase family protein [Ignavibacteria bacterium]
MDSKVNVFWFRRDLRLEDNKGLQHALTSVLPVLPVFIFDTEILDRLEDKSDSRVYFIYQTLKEIDLELKKSGSSLLVLYGKPSEVWKKLIDKYDVYGVFANHDYEPYAIQRDQRIKKLLGKKGIHFNTYKDHVIFEKNEVTKPDGKPYTIFTPYFNKWMERFSLKDVTDYRVKHLLGMFRKFESSMPSLRKIGFNKSKVTFPANELNRSIVKNYEITRDNPSIEGTTRMSVHLRFGTVSIRRLTEEAAKLSPVWLKELIWREFFMMIIYHFPHSAVKSFRPEYDRIKWRNNEDEFETWCSGKTGFPIVDAGMRELNSTGFMHNRVRMITASFLTKNLLIDWRWGERYFAEKLLDYELSSNAGNWQWAAGSGCDAAPYFRVFNPQLQQEKFDPEMKYIKRWIPEFGSPAYPGPMVDHKMARERVIKVYKEALGKQ